MKIQNVKGVRSGEKSNPGDFGEIRGFPRVHSAESVSSVELDPATAALSLGVTEARQPGPMDVLTQYLESFVTWDSVAWTDGAKPKMRALQKQLLEKGLTLDGNEKQSVLDAITIIEGDFTLRMRLEQHHMMDNQIMSAAPPQAGGNNA